jgi:hypothetical protein
VVGKAGAGLGETVDGQVHPGLLQDLHLVGKSGHRRDLPVIGAFG